MAENIEEEKLVAMGDLGDCAQEKLYLPENKKPRLAMEEKEKGAVVENPLVAMEEKAAAVENPPVAMEEKEKGAAVEYPPVTMEELGLCAPYLERWGLEDVDEVDENIYYMDEEDERPADIRGTHDTVKRFLKQVRESRGYDVDCYPPLSVCSPYLPINMGNKYEHARAIQVGNFALDHINAETMVKFGKRYVLLNVEKGVDTLSQMMLLTLTVKEFDACADANADDSDVPVKTLQTMVWAPFHKPFDFIEWRFKPGCT